MFTGRHKLLTLLEKWIERVIAFRLVIIGIMTAAAVACLYYTVNNLGMNTDTQDMLSPELEWRQNDIRMDRLFPQYTDNILIVIEAGTPDEAVDAASRLSGKLKGQKQLFKSVYYPNGLEFFRTSSLLYLDVDELQDLADNLASIQPFLARLTGDQTLHGLFSMLEEAINARMDGEDIDLDPLLKRLDSAFLAVMNNQHHRLSWRALMSGTVENKPVYREFILLQPRLDFAGLFPANHAIENVHQLGRELELAEENGIRLRLTGSAVLSHEELQSVSIGMSIAVVIALCLVAAILIIGLRSVWLVFATLITLITGLLFTAAFATLTVGTLNLISVAFAILYIGLGVDFAIHYCLRYRERLQHNESQADALRTTATTVGESLLLCAVTTAIGFYAFVPTAYHGVAELGWIAGSGMVISFITTMTLLPALLASFPTGILEIRRYYPALFEKLVQLPLTRARWIKSLTLVAVVISLILLPGIRFDHNTLNLQSPDNPSVKTYLDLLDDSDTSPWKGTLLADNPDQARQLDRKISQLEVVDKVVWLDDFIPPEQQEKLLIINEIDLLLLGVIDADLFAPAETGSDIQAISRFNDALAEAVAVKRATVAEMKLHATMNRFMHYLESMPDSHRHATLEQLEQVLLETFPGRLDELQAALTATVVTTENIPDPLKTRWLRDGHYRMEVYPRNNLSDNEAMRTFVRQTQSVVPELTGAPVTSIEAGDAVVNAFSQAFIYALVAIVALLLVITERKRDTLYILLPLMLAILFTAAVSVLLGIPLNFANIIALPMLLGIGVDSAIHILHRFRTSPPENGVLLATSSARAVIVSALTTIFSIGNLAFSRHLGTASMGQLLVIGISMTLICTLFILPGILSGTTKTNNNDTK